MSTRDRPYGIGFYLIALILLAAVPLLIAAGVLVRRQSNLQREAFEKSLLQTALALSVAVDRQLDTYRVMLETLAQDDDLILGRIDGFYALSARVAVRHGAVFISLFDAQGRQLFNTVRPSGEELPTPFTDPRAKTEGGDRPPFGDPSALREVLRTGRPVISDLLYGLVVRRLVFVVNIPVLKDGKVAYILNAAFDPAVMTRLLKDNPQFSGVPAVIFDRSGFIVGRWKDADKFVGTRVASVREHVMPEESGVGVGTTLEGIKVYFSYARSRTTGWGVNVGSPRAELESAIEREWLYGGLLAGGGLVLGVVLALALAARMRRSIAGLADAAAQSRSPLTEGLRAREILQLEEGLREVAAAREAQARERESRVIAETRKAEAEEATRLKDRFIAVLSHELRNPLAPVRNSVSLLRMLQERFDPETLKSVADTLDRQTSQLTRLVNDLLDVSRIGGGRLELQTARLDLRAVVRHAAETIAAAVDQRRLGLNIDLPADAVPVDGDFARLSQVFSNLLDNATKFTPEGGRIDVVLRAEGGDAVLRVTDNGSGIARPDLVRIFTAFAIREGQPEHSGARGLGLGLSLARTLTEMHGGSLEAASAGEGTGSEFTVRLPLAPGVS